MSTPEQTETAGPGRRLLGAALGAWLLLLLLVAVAALPGGSRVVGRTAGLPAALWALVLVVGTLATLRRVGLAGATELVFVLWALGLGALIDAALLLFAWLGPRRGWAGVEIAGLLVLLVCSLWSVIGAIAFAFLWSLVALEVVRLPPGSPAQERLRVAHVAAPGLVITALGAAPFAGSTDTPAHVVVPAPLAVALTLGAVIVGASLWLRLRAARREPA